MFCRKIKISFLVIFLLGACSQRTVLENKMITPPSVTDRTRTGKTLYELPAPKQKVAVVVYEFQDQTGQFKYNDKYTDYSSAITKGGQAILVKALLDAGSERWFSVAERGGLKNLLQERQIINTMRSQFVGKNGNKLPGLPPLLYGGILLEGGIISYDSNVITGGAGAAFLGIGASTQYRRDIVTVYIRAVNVQTGEVMVAVTSAKTIFSTVVDSNLLKYVTYDKLLQAEAGFSVNEPTQLAVRQAIESGVYSLIMEGALRKIWDFKDADAGAKAVEKYLKTRDGEG